MLQWTFFRSKTVISFHIYKFAINFDSIVTFVPRGLIPFIALLVTTSTTTTATCSRLRRPPCIITDGIPKQKTGRHRWQLRKFSSPKWGLVNEDGGDRHKTQSYTISLAVTRISGVVQVLQVGFHSVHGGDVVVRGPSPWKVTDAGLLCKIDVIFKNRLSATSFIIICRVWLLNHSKRWGDSARMTWAPYYLFIIRSNCSNVGRKIPLYLLFVVEETKIISLLPLDASLMANLLSKEEYNERHWCKGVEW